MSCVGKVVLAVVTGTVNTAIYKLSQEDMPTYSDINLTVNVLFTSVVNWEMLCCYGRLKVSVSTTYI